MSKLPLLHFTKMHGLGNDFMVINGMTQSVITETLSIPSLSHRHTGIGFDQLLLIGNSTQADFSCRFFNADGSEAEQCGNGVRCVARFLHENHFLKKDTLRLETKAGIISIHIHDYDHIQVQMGVPCFEPEKIPFIPDKMTLPYPITALSLGNPHAILQVSSIITFPAKEVGAEIGSHPAFPQGTNVGLMEIIDRQHIRLRTIERGVGETYACGTNACAAVVAGIKNHNLDNKVSVELEMGSLLIEWQGLNQPVIMTGPAARVFSGEINA